MKHFKEFEEKAYSFINDGDNFIIFNDGKAIRCNINEDEVELEVDNYIDSFDVCKKKRTDVEEEILSKAYFNNYVHIKKDINLKLIYLNDDEAYLNFSYVFKRGVKANLTHIFLSCQKDCMILRDYNLNDECEVMNNTFNNYENKVCEYNNYYLDDKAKLYINDLNINEVESENTSNVYLYSEKASAYVSNSCINASSKLQKNNYNIYHNEKKTKSELVGYGVVLNDSTLNMDTCGYIKRGSKNANMHQTSKGIILDTYSVMQACPLLYIDEYDCMASHGASIGAISEEDVYYLMSRGLSRYDAEKLIVYGFFNPYLSKINDEKILAYIQEVIAKKLEMR